jgi:hypothetical protein
MGKGGGREKFLMGAGGLPEANFQPFKNSGGKMEIGGSSPYFIDIQLIMRVILRDKDQGAALLKLFTTPKIYFVMWR